MRETPKKRYTYYPGCSSLGSAAHLDKSLRAIAPELDVELEDIEDWNCCGASVGHVEGGALPNMALSGRNLAQAASQAPDDIVTGCASCYLNTHGVNEKIKTDIRARRRVNEALGAADLCYDDDLQVRHACEVLVNDVGLDVIRDRVRNPLDGLEVAGYVGCQTVRPFADTDSGGRYDTYDDPAFLDNFAAACGAEPVAYDPKTACCGGSVSVHSPDKTLHLIKEIVAAAHDSGADVIATPCPLCQQNVEMYQAAINKRFGTDFHMPVVFYSQLMAVAFGLDGTAAALDQNMIPPAKLVDLAKKPNE
ncbi:MAG: CoB--CoM heterodisulfide reductase iron-sulfur subunit B family protein [Alphaproteobacteria bacterium]|jgi:heterodisulfide reductase subunit B|nr:CoB--CoM heterodisulfide reductase iron-sulfur subunit B family protein [Alphaproteobacteria bacterium]MDP6515744.1 CoB--CoM heterodisulfide reductase iron-sulfur subunit B family protein [Alphaproteobacteria bacterium]